MSHQSSYHDTPATIAITSTRPAPATLIRVPALEFDESGQCWQGRLLNALVWHGLNASDIAFEIIEGDDGITPIGVKVTLPGRTVRMAFEEVIEDTRPDSDQFPVIHRPGDTPDDCGDDGPRFPLRHTGQDIDPSQED
jgi:hypothetical protein